MQDTIPYQKYCTLGDINTYYRQPVGFSVQRCSSSLTDSELDTLDSLTYCTDSGLDTCSHDNTVSNKTTATDTTTHCDCSR